MKPIKMVIRNLDAVKIFVQDFPEFFRVRFKAGLKLRMAATTVTAVSGLFRAGSKMRSQITAYVSGRGKLDGKTKLSAKLVPVTEIRGKLDGKEKLRSNIIAGTAIRSSPAKIGAALHTEIAMKSVVPYLNEERGPQTWEEIFADPDARTLEGFLWKVI